MKNRNRYLFVLCALLLAVVIGGGLFSPVKLLSQTDHSAASYYQKGKELKNKGKHDQALDYFKKAINVNPNLEDAHFAMGVTYYKMNLLANAVQSFKEVLRINPGSRETHNNLAVIYEQQGDYELALRELEETVRLDPGYDKGHLNLAKLYLARSIQEYFRVILSEGKDTKEVRKKLHALLESDTESPDLQYNLGLLNRIEGNVDDAVKNLRNAAKLDPVYGHRVSLELADLFEESGKLKEAFKEYDNLSKQDTQNFAAAYGAGRIKNILKEYAAAETFLVKALTIRSSPEAYYELGLAQHGLGRIDDAVASYTESLERKESSQVHWSLGKAYKEKKEYNLALTAFESILEGHPDKEKVQKEIVEVTRLRLAAAAPQRREQTSPSQDEKVSVQTVNNVPAPLVGLEKDKGYALLVDKSSQTLLLYQNQAGQLVHVKTFACSTGKNKGEKIKNGDKKTPEGIYLFTEIKTDRDLLPEYGKMAFPMDYPNLYDRRQNKDGNGIWLHSTNEPLRAYLPEKTRGCVVVNNSDIQELSRIIRLYDTPIVIYNKIPYISPGDQKTLRKEVLSLLSEWEKSWESKDVDRFIGLYSSSFKNEGMDLSAWRSYKRSIFLRKKKIRVQMTPIHLLKHKDYLVVTFRQKYRADSYSDTGIKRLFLVREDNTWRIVGEEWRKI